MEDSERELKGLLLPGDAEPPEDAPSAAVALILRTWGGELQILLIQRVDREGDPWSGQIALPGGMRNADDASLSQTARRETLEEVSIDVEESCLFLGRLSEVRPANLPQIHVFPFVYSLQTETPVMAGQEVKGAFWSSLKEIRRSEGSRKVKVRNHELLVPSFLHEDRIIWGLTYRILTRFLELGVDP